MRLLIVGSGELHAIESVFLKYIKGNNPETIVFPATGLFYEYYYKSILNKIKYRIGISAILKRINAELINVIEAFKPTVIWVFKGMEIFPETLEWAAKKGIQLVNYNPDNPFIFSGRGSGNVNVTKSIKLYNLHFTYNIETEQKLKNEYGVKTSFLPFGFDVSNEWFNECKAEPELIKACFLGNPDKQRVSFLNSLASAGISIDVFGNNWNKFTHHTGITIFPPVYEREFWKILRKYRIQINLMRIHNENSHNMRTFEVPGIGGIMLAPDTREHRLFFETEKEVFLFTDIHNCVAQASKILLLSTDEANDIRNNVREKSIAAGYSYKDRATFALNTIKQL